MRMIRELGISIIVLLVVILAFAIIIMAQTPNPANISVRLDEAKFVGNSPDATIQVRWRILDLTFDTNSAQAGIQPLIYFERNETYSQNENESIAEFRQRVVREETLIRNEKIREIRQSLTRTQAGTDVRNLFANFEVN